MKQLALATALALALGCGGGAPAAAAATPEERALDALAKGEFDAAEGHLRGAKNPEAVHLLAKIHLLRNRPAEAAALLRTLLPTQEHKTVASVLDMQAVAQDLVAAAVRMDDFNTAHQWCARSDNQVLARKYEILAKAVGYLQDRDWEESTVDLVNMTALPLVQGSVNGLRGIFLLDTGLGEILLDRDYAKRAGVSVIGLQAGGTLDEGVATSVTLGRLNVRNVPIQLGRLATHSVVPINGAIGLSFLMHFDFTIDYRRAKLVLRKPGSGTDAPRNAVPAILAGDRNLIVKGKLNGSIETFAGINTGISGVTIAVAEQLLQQHPGEIREALAGPLRLTRPPVNTNAFPTGLGGSFGLPVGFVLGHQAFTSRALRLDPRSMRLSIE
jgi:hypothetical protein